jgi:hypothetical protein
MPDEKTDITTIYADLEKEFKLPKFEALNDDFDIDTIDTSAKHPVKEIAKKMFERVELFKKILETTLQPDVSILSMQEAESLGEKDHETLADVLRRLMRLDRTLLIAELENSDELYVGFIKDTAKEWSAIKTDLRPIFQRMHSSWSTKRTTKQLHHYLG